MYDEDCRNWFLIFLYITYILAYSKTSTHYFWKDSKKKNNETEENESCRKALNVLEIWENSNKKRKLWILHLVDNTGELERAVMSHTVRSDRII